MSCQFYEGAPGYLASWNLAEPYQILPFQEYPDDKHPKDDQDDYQDNHGTSQVELEELNHHINRIPSLGSKVGFAGCLSLHYSSSHGLESLLVAELLGKGVCLLRILSSDS